MINIPALLEGAAGRFEQLFFPEIFRNDPPGEFEIPLIHELIKKEAGLSVDTESGIWTLVMDEDEYVPRLRWPSYSPDPKPVLLWHHASGEVPYTTPTPWGRFNLFNRIFLSSSPPVPDFINAYVEAPLHATHRLFNSKAYADAGSTIKMLCASVMMLEKSISYLKALGYGPVVVAGFSLGGVVASWHQILFGTADVYIPVAACPDFHSMLFSGFLPVGGDTEKRRSLVCYKEALDISGRIDPQSMSKNCFPLLGKHDELVPHDICREIWNGFNVSTVNEGHFTLYLRHDTITDHIRSCCRRL